MIVSDNGPGILQKQEDYTDKSGQAAQGGTGKGGKPEEQLSLIIDALPIVFYTCEAKGNYAVLYINPKASLVCGYNPDDFISNPGLWADNIHPHDRQRVFKELPVLFERGEYYHEYRWKTAGGHYHWFGDFCRLIKTPDGRISHIAGVWLDITERKRVEHRLQQQLKQSQKRFGNIVNRSADGILAADIESQRFVLANKAICKMLGYGRKELLGRGVSDIHPAESLPYVIEQFRKQSSGKIILAKNIPLKRKDGAIIWTDINSSLMHIDGRNCLVGFFRDVTERKQVEEEVRRLNEILEQRIKERTVELETVNKELDAFARIISHDLKAPLRGIDTIAGWLEEDYKLTLSREAGEWISLLRERVLQMHQLIDSVLLYSRSTWSVEKKAKIDLNRLVKKVWEMLLPPSHIDLLITERLPTILSQKTKMEQLFQNLLSNAIKFMDKPKGIIRVGQVNGEDQEEWKFYVSDNGPGIEEKKLAKVFTIFLAWPVKDTKGGTGIGLAIVKKIVSGFGGKVWVESKKGEGATFWFTMPKG